MLMASLSAPPRDQRRLRHFRLMPPPLLLPPLRVPGTSTPLRLVRVNNRNRNRERSERSAFDGQSTITARYRESQHNDLVHKYYSKKLISALPYTQPLLSYTPLGIPPPTPRQYNQLITRQAILFDDHERTPRPGQFRSGTVLQAGRYHR